MTFHDVYQVWLDPVQARYRLDPTNNDGVYGDLVFEPEPDFAYIEPCGQFPNGYHVPLWSLEELLNNRVLMPHYYEREPSQWAAIRSEGLAFDILAESESPEADVIERRLEAIGGHA